MVDLFSGFRNAAKRITCRIPEDLYFLPTYATHFLCGPNVRDKVTDALHAMYEKATYTKFKPGQEIACNDYRLKILGLYEGQYIVLDNDNRLDRLSQMNVDHAFKLVGSSTAYAKSDYASLKYQPGQSLYENIWWQEYKVAGVLKESQAAPSDATYILINKKTWELKMISHHDLEVSQRYVAAAPLRNKPQPPLQPKLECVPG